MAQRRLRADQIQNGNVFTLDQPASMPDATTPALELAYQAADIFHELQNRARETEVRAQSLRRAASEKLRTAEMHEDAAEQAHRELMIEANHKSPDASFGIDP